MVQHDDFRKGNLTTHFIDKNFKPEYLKTETAEEANIAALVAAHFFETKFSSVKSGSAPFVEGGAKNDWRKRREMR